MIKIRKRKRIRRRGSEYSIEIRWRTKPLKRSGMVVAPGRAVQLEVGTANVLIQNNGTFTYAHVIVRHGLLARRA